MTKYSNMEYAGKVFDLYVTSSGWFHAYPQGANADKADSLAAGASHKELVARLKLKARERRVQAKIPFTEITGSTLRDGVARAISIKNYRHEVLVTWADGTKDQISGYGEQLRRVWGEERERIAEAARIAAEAEQTAARAKKWLDHLTKPYRFNLRDAVEAHTRTTAQQAVAQEQEATG